MHEPGQVATMHGGEEDAEDEEEKEVWLSKVVATATPTATPRTAGAADAGDAGDAVVPWRNSITAWAI